MTTLTEQQHAFIARFLGKGLFSKKKNQKILASFEGYTEQEALFKALALEIPKEHEAMKALIKRLPPALAAKDKGDFALATSAMTDLVREAAALKEQLLARRQAILDKMTAQVDPKGIGDKASQALKAERDKVALAMKAAIPTPAEFTAADAALATHLRLARDAVEGPALKKLASQHPKAAAQAGETLKGFTDVIGTLDVTPEVYDQAQKDLALAHQAVSEAKTALANAKKLPPGAEAEIERAQAALILAQNRQASTAQRSNAVMGRKLLLDALAFGPLSSDGPQRLSDEGAQAFASAYAKDPRLADSALASTSRAEHPELVAKNIGTLCDLSVSGFKSDTGRSFTSPDFSRQYAQQLVEMGGAAGPEFFKALPEYMKSGQQFVKKPLGDESSAKTFQDLAQSRSRHVAQAMIKPDGTFDPTLAQPLSLHLMMSPDVLDNGTPELAMHVVRTMGVLTDGKTGKKAAKILEQANASANNPSAFGLVRESLGKAKTEGVDDKDVKAAILTAMMTPMNQGPVGSCFATAPCRKFRQTDPIGTMEKFSQLATTGTLTTAGNTTPVPAVTRVPKGENPLMRSLEYTLATATARQESSKQRKSFNQSTTQGVEQFKPLVDTKKWVAAKNALRQEITNAFDFVYDPIVKTEGSNDGSSSQGRYVIQRVSDKQDITTKAQFVAAITTIAQATLNPDGDEALKTKVNELVQSDAFINAVCPGSYKPWELGSGGATQEVVSTLSGRPVTQTPMLGKTDALPNPGQRTRAVVEGMLNAFQGSTEDMMTIRTVGQHGFNALPNHPSLQALKGGNAQEVSDKVQKNLIEPGIALRDKALEAEHAGHLFDQDMKRRIAAEKNDELKGLLSTALTSQRPSATMTPADLDRCLKTALAPYNTRKSEIEAAAWKKKQETGGTKTVSTSELNKKKTALQGSYDKALDQANKDMLLRELGAPEFIIADTNWGESRYHVYFVVAPDPTTGEPQLWKKTVPPGTMAPVTRDWIDKEWARVE